MSVRDDFLMRQIRQLVEALARLAGFKKAKKDEQALQALGELYTEHTGLSRELVEALDVPALAALLSPGGQLDVTRAVMLGLVLLEQADLEGDPAARAKGVALLGRARDADPAGYYAEHYAVLDGQ